MSPNRFQISRRSVLRGAGALLALPFMESLPALAGEDPKKKGPPLRMGIFTVTGGTVLESWKMKEAGPLTKLPSILRSLEPMKDDMLLLAGLCHHGKSVNLNGHEHCGYTHLTGAPEVKKEGGKSFAGISVDQAAAKITGEETFLPSIEIGLSNQETKYSFRDTSAAIPYESNPRLIFERMFRGRKPIVPNWSRRNSAVAETVQKSAKSDSYDRSVIDLVLEESKAVRSNLSRADQQRLDEYLNSVRSVEKRIDFVEAKQRQELLDAASPGPSKLIELTKMPDATANIWKMTELVHRDPERHAEYIRLMAELLVLAFQTDTTRVATFACGSDESLFPGVVTVGYERHCHTLEHQGNDGRGPQFADPIAREACRQVHAWYTTLFAEMVTKMKAIDEGGSSLLDNSMILYTSYMADGGHGRSDYPALLVGKAGGTLKGGRQINFQKDTPASNLYLEMLDRMGAKLTEFGESKVSSKAAYGGRLPGLNA
jgi:hypothetical protein